MEAGERADETSDRRARGRRRRRRNSERSVTEVRIRLTMPTSPEPSVSLSISLPSWSLFISRLSILVRRLSFSSHGSDSYKADLSISFARPSFSSKLQVLLFFFFFVCDNVTRKDFLSFAANQWKFYFKKRSQQFFFLIDMKHKLEGSDQKFARGAFQLLSCRIMWPTPFIQQFFLPDATWEPDGAL